ncbi:MAG: non-homologous end-joining DNA ligase [Solirubrobacterales bacterium]
MARRRLSDYERKRSFERTPEPRGGGDRPGSGGRFVVQEHHARRLHWDLRLEHDGALASWALPRGVPQDPKRNRLAVRTEDHPLEYLEFEGEIPAGQYGAGTVTIWDRGSYEAEKFRDDEVIFTLAGERVRGRYALFATDGDNWMIHRMDPPVDPDREPMPEHLEPMLATLSEMPRDEHGWAFEIKWDGIRAVAYCEQGELRLESRNLREITSHYPELRAMAAQLGSREAVIDGEVVAFDDQGKPSFERLQSRMNLGSPGAVRRRMTETPVTYLAFDLLFAEGHSLVDLPYSERRERLRELRIDGPSWQTPREHLGEGAALLELTAERGLEGLVAKRLDSRYLVGRRSRAWLKVKNKLSQELVIGGWLPGRGRRSDTLGAVVVGYHDDDGGLRYAGRVGSGLSDHELERLAATLVPLERSGSPFDGRQPPRETVFVDPRLVAEVEFREWTRARTLRAPVYKGLRPGSDPDAVVLERLEAPPADG